MLRNCLDAPLGQIVCDKDGVVDWCIVLLEMPLTDLKSVGLFRRNLFLKPQHPFDCLTPPTPLIIPQRFPAFLESLTPLKN